MSTITDQVYRQVETVTVKADRKKRTLTHLISTNSVDRMGDIVEPGGAQLERYLKNPVVLVDHTNSAANIIGEATEVKVAEDRISATTQFRDTPLARDAMELSLAGLGGWSIGFQGKDVEIIRGEKDEFTGLRFKTWELMEYSYVAIPANQDVVNRAVKTYGLAESSVEKLFRLQKALRVQLAEPEPEITVPNLDLDEYVRRSASQIVRTDAAIAGAKLKGLV